jgi:hypothetical protein
MGENRSPAAVNGCSFVSELPPGGAEVPLISGSVGAVGGHNFNLKIVRIIGAVPAFTPLNGRTMNGRKL